jgi:hypothetical protein
MNTTPQQPQPIKGKGRNADLIRQRNESLVKRFFYWYETKRLRYDDVLRKLSTEEFYISESRIEVIISENQSKLDCLYANKGAKLETVN